MNDTVTVNGAVVQAAPPKLSNASDIRITIKRNVHHIEIDMDKLTWEDGKALRKHRTAIEAGTISEDEAIALMDDIIAKVIGINPNTLPMEVVNRVVDVLFADDADAVAAEGN